jgi:hypothetical protein
LWPKIGGAYKKPIRFGIYKRAQRKYAPPPMEKIKVLNSDGFGKVLYTTKAMLIHIIG